MTIQTSTLRPGLLVSLKTEIRGNIRYATTTIEGAHLTEDGAERARWETEKTVTDPKEHEAAVKARGKARTSVSRICAQSAFGLLCPESMAPQLESAILEARAIADEFNASARWSRLSVHVLTGRIAPDDVEAVRAINSEVRGLLEQMEDGIRRLDAEAIRKAANATRSVGAMLNSAAVERVAIAIQTARGAAKAIVKAGESAALAIDEVAIRKISEQRMAFLDLDEAGEVAAPEITGRAVDLDPDVQAISDAYVNAARRELEL